MKHYNKIKDQIRQEPSELPDGFGWEDMKDDIYQKMEEDPKPSRFLLIFFNKFLLIGIGFLIGIVFITFLFKQRQQNSDKELSKIVELKNEIDLSNVSREEVKTQKLTSQDLTKHSIPNSQSSVESNQLQNASLKNTPSTANTSQEEKAFKNTQQIKPKQNKLANTRGPILDSKSISGSKSNLNQIDQINNVNSSTNILKQPSARTTNEPKNETADLGSKLTQLNTYIQTTPTVSKDSPNESIVEALDKTELNAIDMLPILNAYVQGKQIQINLNAPEVKMNTLITPLQQSLWTIEFGGGWNTLSYGRPNSQEENSLYSDTKGDYGFSFSSRLSRSINPKFSLTSGLDLDIMYKKLDASYTNLEERTIRDTVIGQSINAITGETQEVIGDATVVDTIMNTVKSHNRYQVVTVPLILNYNILRKSNWSLDIGFGPSISFLTNYKGLYVENNELQSFDKASNLYSSSPKIALNTSLQIRKKFANEYFCGLRVDYKNHLSDWAINTANEIKPKIVSGSIVVGKVF